MGNSLVKNSIFNVAYRLLNVLFPLITTTYVARILLADGVGKVAYAQNIVAYFLSLAALGIPNYGTREIAKIRTDAVKTNKLFSELMIINLCSTSFFLLAYYLLVLTLPTFQQDFILYAVVGMSLFFKFFDVTWFYQGFEDFAYITIRSFIVKLVCLAWIFLFVRTKEDFVLYAGVSVLSIGLNDVINIIHLRKFKIKFSLKNVHLKKHLKPVFVLFASVIAIELYTMVDTTMIGLFCNEIAVGLYTNAMKIVRILIGVISGVAGILLPRLSYHYAKNEIDKCSQIVSKTLMVMIFLYIPCQIGILMIGDVIMPFLFGESFAEGGLTLQIASLLICTLGFSNLFGTQILLTFGQEKKLFYCTVVAAVLNLSLNSILIPKFAQNGAACASVVAEGLVTILTCYFSLKYIHVTVEKKFIVVSSISSLFLILAIVFAKSTFDSRIMILAFSMMVGGAFYTTCNFLLQNPILDSVKVLLSKKKSR